MLKYRQQVQQIEEEKKMSYITSFERYGLKIGLEKGMQQGMQQGMEQGMEQGVQKGEQQGTARIILRLLQRKFGSIPQNYLEQILEADTQTLLAMEEKIYNAKTLKDLSRNG